MHELLHRYFQEKTDVDPATFETIRAYFEPKKVRRNEVLLSAGDVCRHHYFVTKGCIRIYTLTPEGQELTRYFTFEGKFGTALTSLIEQQPSFEFLQAIEKSEVLVIGRDDFFQLVDTVPQFNLIYRDMLEMAYITSQKRIYGLQGESALERLRWLMRYQPKIVSRLSNKVIASYLGVTPYTLSRLKTEL
ncbi:cAMP-binding domain of CRP or a regulatory subunit of cAMP-dependent protein kinases [Catalinimonas alkaloidigena]|uniref:cAMP-binding domain of CRP or a regulatory subunit of cAMP-dependent protein kinases n=1 Tax=Catalinimonas alkaloidigena TaxID=1075417 RepID=A0A1G9R725_9BACT|nr:Crp/Fnr family transcriptional regulator [Catalinimonas alkaloidigena]SDM19038.1 cAMP-binding domain of CRP or a regulatory subunit of cAMP-dependent protein kinases [Catalinimonas alkaloidigena]